MNKRIQELAKQAGLKIEYQMINPPKPLQILGSAEQFEKFAELLMKECADYVDSAISDGGVDGRSLKEHFGVGE